MLLHPWDAPLDAREWLKAPAMFGQLVVTNVGPLEAPLVVATHAVLDGDSSSLADGPGLCAAGDGD